jgi:hypothetical protein
VTRIAPGVVWLLAELGAHARQAAGEWGQWKTRVEERKVIDATSPAAVTLALLLTDEEGTGSAKVPCAELCCERASVPEKTTR